MTGALTSSGAITGSSTVQVNNNQLLQQLFCSGDASDGANMTLGYNSIDEFSDLTFLARIVVPDGQFGADQDTTAVTSYRWCWINFSRWSYKQVQLMFQ